MRQCGSCGLCCKLISIRSLHKPANQWCEYWEKGTGCKIEHVKPEACRQFACLWLAGKLPERLTPRKTGVVVWQRDKRELYVHRNHHAPGFDEFTPIIEEWMKNGFMVKVVQGQTICG